MNVLILKLNAAGDVVRTTTLLRRLSGDVTWITAKSNVDLLPESNESFRCLSWEQRTQARDRRYDLVISLEDEQQVAAFVNQVQHAQRFGAFLSDAGQVIYTDDARRWFDLSLISVFGRTRADELKLLNRKTYQELIFEGLGLQFEGEAYVLPARKDTPLTGDVAIAPTAGPVWPMKGWAYYNHLQDELEANGLIVNVLPHRSTLHEHMADVSGHRCLVSGDSLPMHFALGTGTPCVTLFNCTSPWEIFDYGIQTKLVSPLLDRFFYQRGFDIAATTAIPVPEVFDAVMDVLRDGVGPRTLSVNARSLPNLARRHAQLAESALGRE